MNLSAEDMFLIDAIGYFGYLLLCLGMYGIARGRKMGWAARACGESIWIVLSYKLGLTSGVVFGIIFLALDLFGFYHPAISAPPATDTE